MADPISPYVTFRFQDPKTGKTYKKDFLSESLRPDHDEFNQTMEEIRTMRLKFGEPLEIKEPDVKMNFAEGMLYNMVQVGKGLLAQPWNTMKALQTGIMGLPNITQLDPEKFDIVQRGDAVSAEDYKSAMQTGLEIAGSVTPMGGVGLLAKAPRVAGLLSRIPGGVKSVMAMTGAAGAGAGAYAAGKAAEEAELISDPELMGMNAAFIDFVAGGAVGRAGGAASRWATRKVLGGESTEEALAKFNALKRSGVAHPATVQLQRHPTGMGPRIMKLSTDMPYSEIAEKWVYEELDNVHRAFTNQVTEGVTRQVGGRELFKGGRIGAMSKAAWTRRGNALKDEAWAKLPQGVNTQIDTEPIFDALYRNGMLTDEFLTTLRKNPTKWAKRLSGFIERYRTGVPNIAQPGGPQKWVFQDAPLHEVEAARQAVGDYYRASELRGFDYGSLDDRARDDLYGSIKESIRREMQKADKATPGLGAEKSFDEAFEFITRHANDDVDYMRQFVRLTNESDALMKLDSALSKGQTRTINTIMERLDEISKMDPKVAKTQFGVDDPRAFADRARRDMQEAVITRRSFDDEGQFSPQMFAAWYGGLDEAAKKAFFGPEQIRALDDFLVTGRAFWPETSKTGALFIQQQMERPFNVAQQAGVLSPAMMGGMAGMAGGGEMSPMKAALSTIFIAIPTIGTRMMTSPAIVRWVTNSTRPGVTMGQALGTLSAIALRSGDPETQETAMQLLDAFDAGYSNPQAPQNIQAQAPGLLGQ